MSLGAPIAKVSGSGSAEEGTGHFWGQRLSAIGLLLLGLWFVGSMAILPGYSHGDAMSFIAAPVNGVLLLLLVVMTAYHSVLGVQVVVEDYVHGQGLKLVSLNISRFAHVFLVVAAIYAIIKIGLGA